MQVFESRSLIEPGYSLKQRQLSKDPELDIHLNTFRRYDVPDNELKTLRDFYKREIPESDWDLFTKIMVTAFDNGLGQHNLADELEGFLDLVYDGLTDNEVKKDFLPDLENTIKMWLGSYSAQSSNECKNPSLLLVNDKKAAICQSPAKFYIDDSDDYVDFANPRRLFKDIPVEKIEPYYKNINNLNRWFNDEKGENSKQKFTFGFYSLLVVNASVSQLERWSDLFIWLEQEDLPSKEYTDGFIKLVGLGANDEELRAYNRASKLYIDTVYASSQPASLDEMINNFSNIVKSKSISKEDKGVLIEEELRKANNFNNDQKRLMWNRFGMIFMRVARFGGVGLGILRALGF